MRKASFAVAGCVLAVAVFAADAAPIPKEGNSSGTQIQSGAIQVVPLGKDRARLAYDVSGARVGEPSDILHNASIRCVGALTVVAGSFDDESGVCILTRPDGDQVFSSFKGAGKAGAQAKGTYKYTGGTGKFAGIEGGGEWTRYNVRPSAEGTSQSVSKLTGTYKLPAVSASR